jgi:prepilin-type N-terminal cleavage/methylation domain-containing protein
MNKRGVTLVEILISAAILSLVMVGIILTLAQTVDISKRINFEYTALNLAKSRIEQARRLIGTNGFDSLVDLDETDTVLDEEGVGDENGDFRRSTSVTASYGGDPNITMIDVSVEYKYRGLWKENAAVNLATLLTDIY